MKYTVEESLRNFKFWGGAKDRAEACSPDELDALEQFLEEIGSECGWTDDDINNAFWFDFDTLAQHLGYDDEEDFFRKHDPNYVDDDQLQEYCPEWFRSVIDELISHPSPESLEGLNVLAELFGYYSTEKDDDKFMRDNYDFLATITEGDRIIETLFDDNTGHEALPDVLPTLEDFRERIMNKIASEKDGQAAE